MKYLVSCLCLVVISLGIKAQLPAHDTSGITLNAIRFNVMGIVDLFDGNLSVGGEFPLNSRLSVTADVGLILYSVYIQENKGVLGYMIKPALRFYTADNHRGFLEGVFFYKQVGYKMEDWIDKQPVNGSPTYQQFEEFTMRKRVIGLNFQAGLQRTISRDKALKIEGYIGIGIRAKWQDIKDNPDATYQGNTIFFSRDDRDFYMLPSLPLGVRLVYAIK